MSRTIGPTASSQMSKMSISRTVGPGSANSQTGQRSMDMFVSTKNLLSGQ